MWYLAGGRQVTDRWTDDGRRSGQDMTKQLFRPSGLRRTSQQPGRGGFYSTRRETSVLGGAGRIYPAGLSNRSPRTDRRHSSPWKAAASTLTADAHRAEPVCEQAPTRGLCGQPVSARPLREGMSEYEPCSVMSLGQHAGSSVVCRADVTPRAFRAGEERSPRGCLWDAVQWWTSYALVSESQQKP